jgi:saxitoxin biosynthesis operon SxtJ-like protein
MTSQIKQLRSFGLTVGGVFLALGVWPVLWRDDDPRLWAVGLGAVLMLSGVLRPTMLAPVYRIWMALGHRLGWINTKLILGLLFYVVFTPLGWLARLMGRDPLYLKIVSGSGTYRVGRRARPPSHVMHQF